MKAFWLFPVLLILSGCSPPEFTAIEQRCAAAPDPGRCEQQGYDAFYVGERAKLRRVGGP